VATQLQLDDIRRAWEAQDPQLVPLVTQLAEQPEKPPKTPPREGALTFTRFIATIQSHAFRNKTDAEQAHYRIETMKALEAANAEVPLDDKLRLHEILLTLWSDNGLFARTALLKIINTVPLTYGPWRALKRIFKESEARGDTEVFGALAARFDMAYAAGQYKISVATLAYLCRRAWRFLRRTGVTLPAAYADACVDVLANYSNDTRWLRTWVANHIFYHEEKKYNRSRFTYYKAPLSLLTNRGFADLWKRSPRPLFSLLERAKSEQVRLFATESLKTDFRSLLREVEPEWVARLVNVGSPTIDTFVVWILNNVPRFEQGNFRGLGLHEAVLRLFDSGSADAQTYAAEYARTHARDLPVTELVRLANNNNQTVRKLAADLLLARDPRKEVGLDVWGTLLETQHGHELAAGVIKKSFGVKELTPEWFADRLFTQYNPAFEFLKKLLPQIHPAEKLGAAYFSGLIDRIKQQPASAGHVIALALTELARFDLNTLDADFLKRLLLMPHSRGNVVRWIDEGRLKAQTLGTPFLKTVAFHPDFEADPWVAELKASDRAWAKDLKFDEGLADQVLTWLRDVRRFTAADLSQDWLMKLVVRSEPRYHEFAVETLTKAFVPADFAPQQAAAAPTAEAGPVKVDLEGASFVFTGKMATMDRKEAEKQVRANNGVNFGSVTNKLYYLVIGDEGSPLYGQGKKGTKQVKAEEINAAGGNIKIISETAFLQMLAGRPQTVSADATLAGCERLWHLATAPGPDDAPLGRFARQYIRMHHPDICLAETDRPVDPGADVPQAFLTFDRVRPLFSETRKPLRDFALELAKWEFARWAPPVPELVRLCEVPFSDVRQFVANALLADDAPEHRRYRVDPAVLTASAVYSFCESPEDATRSLGMQLIKRIPRLQVPEELFRLTESPDRRVRAFVIRSIWSLYRDRGITEGWKPYVPPKSDIGTSKKPKKAEPVPERSTGAPDRPQQLPANFQALQEFMRRILFEIPPGRLPPTPKEEGESLMQRVKPLPARKAKLSLVEVIRDLALEEKEFAAVVTPLLEEFMESRGLSERAACLVAVTRIRKQFGQPTAPAGAAR
jgi:hypothetical protein